MCVINLPAMIIDKAMTNDPTNVGFIFFKSQQLFKIIELPGSFFPKSSLEGPFLYIKQLF